MSNNIVMLILPAVFILAGIGIIIYARKQLAEAKASLQWPEADGAVIDSRIGVKMETPNRNSNNRTSINLTPRYYYRAEVAYQYEVNGVKHIGDRVSITDVWHNTQAAAAQTLARYPKDGKIKVRYNPEKPGSSLLEPGVTRNARLAPWGGLLFAVVGVALLVFFYYRHVPPF